MYHQSVLWLLRDYPIHVRQGVISIATIVCAAVTFLAQLKTLQRTLPS
jgi:hypothetical protein